MAGGAPPDTAGDRGTRLDLRVALRLVQRGPGEPLLPAVLPAVGAGGGVLQSGHRPGHGWRSRHPVRRLLISGGVGGRLAPSHGAGRDLLLAGRLPPLPHTTPTN